MEVCPNCSSKKTIKKGIRKNNTYLLEAQSASEPVPDGWSCRIWTDQGITPGFYGKTELKKGEWYHIAGTYDGKNVEMYINGEPESKKGALDSGGADWKPQWGGKITPGSPLQLKYGSESYTGGIDEVVLFNRALAEDEIKQLLLGWADAFPVHRQGKMAVTWGEVKSQDQICRACTELVEVSSFQTRQTVVEM